MPTYPAMRQKRSVFCTGNFMVANPRFCCHLTYALQNDGCEWKMTRRRMHVALSSLALRGACRSSWSFMKMVRRTRDGNIMVDFSFVFVRENFYQICASWLVQYFFLTERSRMTNKSRSGPPCATTTRWTPRGIPRICAKSTWPDLAAALPTCGTTIDCQ